MASVLLWESVVKSTKCHALSVLLCLFILLVVSAYVNCIVLYFFCGVILLMPLISPVVAMRMPKKRVSPTRKAVFISGCDSGFGHMLAQRLDDIGFHVFAGCLFPYGDGAHDLRKSGSERLHVIPLDVTNDGSVDEAVAYVKNSLGDNMLWAVVNNAGITVIGEVDWIRMKSIEKVMQVNALGPVRVTKAFLPMLKEGKGKIITIISQAGYVAIPGISPYCMSKAATIRFFDSLRLELYKWGIQVISIEPFFYRTPMIQKEEIRKKSMKEWESVSKETRGLYSSNHIEKLIDKMLYLFGWSANEPNEIVSLLENVITDMHPADSYAPGSHLFRLVTWALQFLPKSVGDIVRMYGAVGGEFI